VYFRAGISWSLISIGAPSFRAFGYGFIIGHKGPGIFVEHSAQLHVLAFLNSCVATKFLGVLSPTVGFEIGQIENLPYRNAGDLVAKNAETLIDIHKGDWNRSEVSWTFERQPMIDGESEATLQLAFDRYRDVLDDQSKMTKALEEENNGVFIDCFGLSDSASG
jgi:hypothetical protein